MADDASYAAFLSKANEPMPKTTSTSTSQSHSKFDPTTLSNDAVPAALKSIPKKLTYTSDTDSPFEPVLLNYAGSSLPSADEFSKCLGAGKKGTVEVLSVEDWDVAGEYGEVVDAVKQAGEGTEQVKVYRVEVGATRVDYYVLTVGDRKLVGVVTTAVES